MSVTALKELNVPYTVDAVSTVIKAVHGVRKKSVGIATTRFECKDVKKHVVFEAFDGR